MGPRTRPANDLVRPAGFCRSKRLLLWALAGAAVASAMLCASACAAWARSYFVSDLVECDAPRMSVAIGTSRGELQLWNNRFLSDFPNYVPDGKSFDIARHTTASIDSRQGGALGFKLILRYPVKAFPMPTSIIPDGPEPSPPTTGYGTLLVMPVWFVILVASWPVLFIRALANGRRWRRGFPALA